MRRDLKTTANHGQQQMTKRLTIDWNAAHDDPPSPTSSRAHPHFQSPRPPRPTPCPGLPSQITSYRRTQPFWVQMRVVCLQAPPGYWLSSVLPEKMSGFAHSTVLRGGACPKTDASQEPLCSSLLFSARLIGGGELLFAPLCLAFLGSASATV